MPAPTSQPALAADDITRAGQPLDHAWTLPPAAYTDPQVYARETDRILRRSWVPLARLDQIPAPGDYLAMDLMDQPVLVVHGTDGEIRVMSAVCLHRAAPLAPDQKGNRKLFTCPYHAWSYDTAGALVRAPLMTGADGFTEKTCRLPQIRSEIWQGFIMASLDPDAAPFAPQIAAYTEQVAPYRLADMAVARTLEFDSPWNWKVLVENFMEAYHHIATHSATLEPVFHAVDSTIPDNAGEPWSILRMPAADASGPRPEGTVEDLPDDQAHDLLATVIFPHFLLGIQGNGVAWYQLLPHSHDRFTLKIHILLPRATVPEDKWEETAEGVAALITAIHEEDIAANDLVWRGLQAPLTRQGRLSPLEKAIWQINQWWLTRMGY
jgi:phenylpropionate dioxygenase-like ring-hydroxylating dioxygenase large terminal subunit